MPDEITREQIDGAKLFVLRRALFDAGKSAEGADALAKQHAHRVEFDATGIDVLKFDQLTAEILQSSASESQTGGYDPVKAGLEMAGAQSKQNAGNGAFR